MANTKKKKAVMPQAEEAFLVENVVEDFEKEKGQDSFLEQELGYECDKTLEAGSDEQNKEIEEIVDKKNEEQKVVPATKKGTIIRIFNNSAMVEVDGVRSLVSLPNAKRYRNGDIIQL